MDYANGKITLRDGRSAGALGISFEGDLDMDRDKVALKGTVVPVDTFNKIVAAIPLIGDALTGGSRGGFLGWTYSGRRPNQRPAGFGQSAVGVRPGIPAQPVLPGTRSSREPTRPADAKPTDQAEANRLALPAPVIG